MVGTFHDLPSSRAGGLCEFVNDRRVIKLYSVTNYCYCKRVLCIQVQVQDQGGFPEIHV